MIRALPARGFSAAMTLRSCGEAFSIRVMSRATARGSPLRARAIRSSTSAFRASVATLGPSDLQDQGVALAAAAAQPGRAHSATATAQLVRQVQHDAGPGHADRV